MVRNNTCVLREENVRAGQVAFLPGNKVKRKTSAAFLKQWYAHRTGTQGYYRGYASRKLTNISVNTDTWV